MEHLPGDDFNRRGNWHELLMPLGWTLAFTRRDGAEMWRRPGKSQRDGISATVRDFEGIELFHAFTSNSDPFPSEESITKFAAYTLIEHDGDYEAAARQLGKEGYGDQSRGRDWIETTFEAKRDESLGRRWLSNVRVIRAGSLLRSFRDSDKSKWEQRLSANIPADAITEGWWPDPSDPATLGCLMSNARSRWGDESYTVSWDKGVWRFYDGEGICQVQAAETEAEAMVMALEKWTLEKEIEYGVAEEIRDERRRKQNQEEG